MAEPVLERVIRPELSIRGWVGGRIAATLHNWLLAAPAANPAMLQMFRNRDQGDRPPSEVLLPWSGEFAGKHLIAGAQFLRLTQDDDLRVRFDAFVHRLRRYFERPSYFNNRKTGPNSGTSLLYA